MNADLIQKIIVPIGVAVLSGTTISSLVIFFVQRYDTKVKEEKKEKSTGKFINEIALSAKRCELLIMMYHRSEDHIAILMAAHDYFVDLNGNSYMGPIFKKWLIENNVPIPPWFGEHNN